MAKKRATHKIKFNFCGKNSSLEVPMFAPMGHQSYSGFGIHQDKNRKAERRNRKLEEKRAKLGDW